MGNIKSEYQYKFLYRIASDIDICNAILKSMQKSIVSLIYLQKSNSFHEFSNGRFANGESIRLAREEAKKHNAELVGSVFDVPDDEFDFPRNNYVLPCLCKKARDLMGLNDTRRVLLKARIMARQSALHSEIRTPLKNKATIYNALYKTGEVIYRNWNDRTYYYAFVKGAGGDYYSCVVDTDPDNDYIEIVDWRIIKEEGYKRMLKQ